MQDTKKTETSEEENTVRRNLSHEESIIILSGPAVWANYFYTTFEQLGLKITFAEKNPAIDLPAFRTAVYLDPGSAVALRDLLSDYIERISNGIPPNG